MEKTPALKLPKDIVADPRHDALVELLTSNAAPLWENGRNPVPTLPLSLALASELRHALTAGLATQGLEQISSELASEQRGLDALAKKSPASIQPGRVSRVLFLANDGSERFYHDCDSLLSRYSQRLMACRLDVPGEELGMALLGHPKLVRAVLVTDKKAASRVLLSLVSPASK